MTFPILYKIEEASSDNKTAAWAAGFGPIASMPFLHPTERARLDAFWKVNPMMPGLLIDPGGRFWPDFMGSGSMGPPFLVSERVIDRFRKINAPVARVTEMPIAEINAKALQSKPAPRYFVIETIPGIEIDFSTGSMSTDRTGNPILDQRSKPRPRSVTVCARTWNGSDLFDYANCGQGPYLNLLCTERVRRLAEEEAWTNARFSPLTVI